jgi:hypothetical protein
VAPSLLTFELASLFVLLLFELLLFELLLVVFGAVVAVFRGVGLGLVGEDGVAKVPLLDSRFGVGLGDAKSAVAGE